MWRVLPVLFAASCLDGFTLGRPACTFERVAVEDAPLVLRLDGAFALRSMWNGAVRLAPASGAFAVDIDVNTSDASIGGADLPTREDCAYALVLHGSKVGKATLSVDDNDAPATVSALLASSPAGREGFVTRADFAMEWTPLARAAPTLDDEVGLHVVEWRLSGSALTLVDGPFGGTMLDLSLATRDDRGRERYVSLSIDPS